MKIEKVNDHQIRCTLTKADLADRELKISELAYGTEKAKNLFRDMMQQASYEFGFEAEDIPLMIEAIPLNSDCIVLIITKVEDPEELDTRFSKFAPSVHEEDSDDSNLNQLINELSDGADDVLDLFKKIHDGKKEQDKDEDVVNKDNTLKPRKLKTAQANEKNAIVNFQRVYLFDQLGQLIQVAKILNGYQLGLNSLYKNSQKDVYCLLAKKEELTPEEFNKLCNVLSEYGISDKSTSLNEAFLDEHCTLIIKDDAIKSLTLL